MVKRAGSKKPKAPTDRDVDDALRVLRADYYTDVLDEARDLAKRMKSGEIEEFSDALHEACDSNQRVIYTQKAQIGLLCSDNEDAYADEFGEVPLQGGTVNWSAMMFFAFQQDILERLDAGGVSVHDPDTWPDIDLKEFD